MAKQVGGLEQLLMQELQDLFDAEKQLVRALPKMAKSAIDEELESALRAHLEVTRHQVQRIEQVFESMNMRARSRPSKGMRGIVEGGREVLEGERAATILDSAIAGSARKVEHYEMAGYESARSLARQLGMRDAAQLLEETLREEIEADKQLARISRRLLKESSARQREEAGAARRGGTERSTSRPGGEGRTASARGGARRATARSARGTERNAGGSAHPLIDHVRIRYWAEERGAKPACVKGTGSRGDIGMIRLDFPGYAGEESLQPISWDDWFRKFDERELALMVQDTTARGEKSNFNKLIKREAAAERPKAIAAR